MPVSFRVNFRFYLLGKVPNKGCVSEFRRALLMFSVIYALLNNYSKPIDGRVCVVCATRLQIIIVGKSATKCNLFSFYTLVHSTNVRI